MAVGRWFVRLWLEFRGWWLMVGSEVSDGGGWWLVDGLLSVHCKGSGNAKEKLETTKGDLETSGPDLGTSNRN